MKLIKILATLAVVAPVATGCSLFGSSSSTPPSPSMSSSGSMSSSMASTPAMTTAPAKAVAPKTAGMTSACANSDLSVTRGMNNGTAGSNYLKLVFTNTSMTPCTLAGYPGVSLTTAKSQMSQIGAAADRTTMNAPKTVTLKPGKTATALLRIIDAGNFPADQGHMVQSSYLQVYVPNQMSPVYVPYMTEGSSVKSVHLLQVSPVVG